MRRVLLSLVAFIFTLSLTAQDKKTPKNSAWKKGGMFTLNIGQGGSRNWAAGAEKFSFTAAGYLNLYAIKTVGRNQWYNSADLGYAMVNTTSLGVRKNDDKIDLLSKYTHQLKNPKWSIGGLTNLRTQFVNGYDYSVTPKRRTSGFFAPGYVMGALGAEWKPCNAFSWFISPAALRWTIVTNNPYSFNYQGGVKPDGSGETPLAELYGVNPLREVDFQAGVLSSMNVNADVCKNVNYRSRLDLYSNVLRDEPFNIDVYWTNSIGMKVNKWLQVSYNFDLIYDHDVQQFGPFKNRPGTQMRSMLGVGVAAKF